MVNGYETCLSKLPFFSQRVGSFCTFSFTFLFHFVWKDEQGSTATLSAFPTTHTKRKWMLSAFRLVIFFFNEYGRIWWHSVTCQKSLNTCILSYVIEAFIKIDSFWSHIWCRCFIHELLFLQKLCGSYFIFLDWICHDLLCFFFVKFILI